MAEAIRNRGKSGLTIFALSSGAPPAAIAVVRVSGARAGNIVEALAERLPEARRATLLSLRDPDQGELLDRALVLWFPGPDSATGEDLAELHLHGGRAVIDSVERALLRLGVRRAEPGEFTRRALINGRIDLAEAEGLGDLLMAQTDHQRRAALASTEGAVSREVAGWSVALLGIAARIEAEIDFSDEDDVPVDTSGEVRTELAALVQVMTTALANPPVERLRDGISVVLAGPPNAGKSTLLNALIERNAAIVSPIAGTTRDRIEAQVVIDGHAFRFSDTAGLVDETSDTIEQIGVARTRSALAEADVVLWMGDETPPAINARVIRLHSRADLSERENAPAGSLKLSARTGLGLNKLRSILVLAARAFEPKLDLLVLNRRQHDLARECMEALVTALDESDPILFAEHLRHARARLDAITGSTGTEAMLDTLFSRFCVGK